MKDYNSYHQVRQDLMNQSITCVELVTQYLNQISDHNPKINAFLEVFEREALDRAVDIDQKVSQGNAGRLAGFVIGIKDLFCLKGQNMTCSSRILEGFESLITATCIQRLLDEDAIIIGRQNCDEFAMGSSNENSAFGNTLNPVDQTRVPGGSSGGSAAAVAADMCLASIGSDTGGSIRQPAAFCGVVGFKPNYSRISRYGLTAYSSSFDTVGTITKNVEDAALLLEVMAGEDALDSTSARMPKPAVNWDEKPSGKIALISNYQSAEGMNPAVKLALDRSVDNLRGRGFEFGEVDFPYVDYLLPTYYILTSAEASTNLSRYDGVRYGYQVSDPDDLESMYKRTRTEGFGSEVLRRILIGTFVLSASYHDAFYTQAQKARELMKRFTRKIFESYDYIMLPTSPTPAFKIGEKTQDPVEMYLSDLFTVQASMAGLPAISMPVKSNGLPIGVQVIGGEFEEAKLLRFSKVLETL